MNTNPWFVLLLGMATVFFGLVCIIFLTKLMSYAIRASERKKKPEVNAQPAVAAKAQASYPDPAIDDRPRFDAAVAAAIATFVGTDMTGLRIHSVKRVSSVDASRPQFVAAVAAAIATASDTKADGLRIMSIKQV